MFAGALLLFACAGGVFAQQVIQGDANLLHRAPIRYPAEALRNKLQGIVVVEATLNERGLVTDAHVITGLAPLRKAALVSILNWHYAPGTPSPMQVVIDFKTPAPRSVLLNGEPFSGTLPEPAKQPEPRKLDIGIIKRIQFIDVSAEAQDRLLAELPFREGDSVQSDAVPRIIEVLRAVDEHLTANYQLLDFDGNRRQFSLKISYASRD